MDNMYFSKENPQIEARKKGRKIFNFLNMHSLYLFNNNFKFKESVSSRDCINFPDGMIIAKKIKSKKFRGPDFTRTFLLSDLAKKKKHFFIGLNENEIEKLSHITGIEEKNIEAHNPPFISGIEFSKKNKQIMTKKINSSKSDYLWICVGNPKQEILGYQLFDSIKANKIFNVGAALDFLLGRKKESPKFWQRTGLEWLYLGLQTLREH